jgi:membrane protein
LILGPNLTTTEARTAPQAPAEPPLPTDLAALKLEVIRKRVEWGRVRRSGGGGLASLMAMVMWLLARVNMLLPMRAYMHYLRQRGALLSAGIGFRMFFSITGLLATGFALAGIFLSGNPALLDQIIKSVATAAPGLLKVDGSEGLVDPYQLLNPASLGWAAAIAAVVTVFTSLGWISGIRDGVRSMMQLGPLVMNPVLQILKDIGTLLLMGVALVVSSAVSLVFGTAAGWVTEQLHLDPVLAGPLTTSITILVPLLLGWGTAVIMYRVAAGLKPARRSLLEGTILAAVGTTVLQIFSTQLLASAGKNPILAPFAIIIGLLIWFNLVSQVYVVCAAWVAIREMDLKAGPANATIGWGARRVQPGKTPVEHRPRRGSLSAAFRRRGTGRPTPK